MSNIPWEKMAVDESDPDYWAYKFAGVARALNRLQKAGNPDYKNEAVRKAYGVALDELKRLLDLVNEKTGKPQWKS